ncbi:hypothetical protein QJS10_CPA16g00316 [Acorus calamus]|uniref:Uncharacterized protein n=1 Tax=Acorus calamus TaxID=4465 RepID=A0AAV9D2G2_ACOCL|nr:hypothetical protein QJS10_CPA16g00316 [Acorus calamus]
MAAGRLPTVAVASLLLLMPLSLLARPASIASVSVLYLAPSESVLLHPSAAGVEGGTLDPYLNADLAEYKDGGCDINGTSTIPEAAAGMTLNSTTSQVQDIRSKLPKSLPSDAKAGEAILNGIQGGTSDGGAAASFSVLSVSVDHFSN